MLNLGLEKGLYMGLGAYPSSPVVPVSSVSSMHIGMHIYIPDV